MSKEFATKLHEAAGKGYVREVERLLDRGEDINQKGDDGWAPIHCAVKYGKWEVVKLLAERGADLQAVTSDNRTPFIIATEHGNVILMHFLMNKGVDTDSKDEQSALHNAALMNQPKAVRFLCGLGFNPYCKDKSDETPLEIAGRLGHTKTMSVLGNLYTKLEAVSNFFKDDFDPKKELAISDLRNFYMIAYQTHGLGTLILQDASVDNYSKLHSSMVYYINANATLYFGICKDQNSFGLPTELVAKIFSYIQYDLMYDHETEKFDLQISGQLMESDY